MISDWSGLVLRPVSKSCGVGIMFWTGMIVAFVKGCRVKSYRLMGMPAPTETTFGMSWGMPGAPERVGDPRTNADSSGDCLTMRPRFGPVHGVPSTTGAGWYQASCCVIVAGRFDTI